MIRVLKVGDWFSDEDSVFVFADNNPAIPRDDAWIRGVLTGADTTPACGAQRPRDLSFAGQAGLFTADIVRRERPCAAM